MGLVIADHVGTPDVFLDLGIGPEISEAHLAKQAWPDTEIIGIEADPNRFAKHRTKFPGTLLNYAVGNEIGKKNFFVDPKTKLWSCFGKPGQPQIFVYGTTLDQVDSEWGPFKRAVVWADIEGSEYDMLLGSEKLVHEGRIAGFHLEVRHEAPYDGWCTYEQINALLTHWGYKQRVRFKPKRRFRIQKRPKHFDVIYTRD